jgi:hypothetical protein
MLTDDEFRVLEHCAMIDPHGLRVSPIIHPRCVAAIPALVRKGWLSRYDGQPDGPYYWITEKGRRALHVHGRAAA